MLAFTLLCKVAAFSPGLSALSSWRQSRPAALALSPSALLLPDRDQRKSSFRIHPTTSSEMNAPADSRSLHSLMVMHSQMLFVKQVCRRCDYTHEAGMCTTVYMHVMLE